MKSPRLWAIVILLSTTLLLLRVRGDVDKVPPSAPLSLLPSQIDGWTGTDIPLSDDVLEVLGKGSFLNRIYYPNGTVQSDSMGAVQNIGLFIGYFPTQRTGQAIHSPQNCLPGAGWTFDSKGTADIVDNTGKHYQVGEYMISNGKAHDEVLYWYRSHGRSIASDYKAKMYTLVDSIRYDRTDAALIRIITPMQQGETPAAAHDRAVGFARDLVPLLPPYIPD